MESILVLEDDENFRSLLADTLGDEGYEITEAASAEEAIACAQNRPFHLILSDVRMAGPLDGVGAIERIKAFRPHIRSIVLTGFTDQDVPLRAAKVQADDYLFKPVEAPQLLDVVRLTLDRESDTLGLLGQILQTPGDLAQKALSWLYDGKLQQLGQLRERCFQRLFVLLRSNRLSAEDAYPVYLQILDVESKYHQSRPGDWSKLLTAYKTVEGQILAATAHETIPRPNNPTLTWPKFQRFCQIMKDGVISAEQFQQSALLFLDPTLRRANLANYLAYQKLWPAGATNPQAADRLIGKTFGGYTLRKLLPEYTEVCVYSAMNAAGLKRQVMAFPTGAASRDLVPTAIQTGKALSLGQHGDFDLFLLQQQSHPLRQQLPPGGLPPLEAWEFLKPVFLQVQTYHERGEYSGNLTIDDIEMVPGHPAILTRFSPDLTLATIQEVQERKARGSSDRERIVMRWRVPVEVMCGLIEKPIPESDQFMLSYLFSRVLKGYETSLSLLGFSVSTSQSVQVETDSHWSHLREHPDLRSVLVKMGNHDYQLRYPCLQEAIEAIDQALKPRPLSSLIPPEGLKPAEAWKVLRPLFLQIEEYHRQGIASGSFTIKHVEVSPEKEARIPHFSPDQSLQHIERSKLHKRQLLSEIFTLPNEIAFATVERPLFASDQPLLGRIFAQVLGGPSRKNWYQPLLLHTTNESSWLQIHTPFFQELAPCICRLTRPDPADRFPRITDAIQAIDQILLSQEEPQCVT